MKPGHKPAARPQEPAPRPPDELEGDSGDDVVIGRALRRSLIALVAIVAVGIGAYVWFTLPAAKPKTRVTAISLPKSRRTATVAIPAIPLRDITAEAGITFTHENGAYGDKLLPETMGSGCALIDYDNDADQDLLLVNSDWWPWHPKTGTRPTLTLYRNDGGGHFTDVTAEAGLNISCYGMGVAIGDYDNDGWTDMFITAVGKNRLLHNDHGKFVDFTAAAKVGGSESQWSTGATWIDFDRDGDLDLFVGNYVRWTKDLDLAQDFQLVGVGRAYGPPTAFEGAFPYLYRNDGGGKFTDISEQAGIQVRNPATGMPMAKSLGIAPVDIDRDGWMDLFVANDTVQNFVFRNQHDGTFQEVGAVYGLAFDSGGKARGGMGADAANFRNDQSLGVVVGNFANEMTALYVSLDKQPQFSDFALATGLGPPTRLSLTFGVFFFDADLDGRLDLLSANGHLEQAINQVQVSQHYQQPPKLFWNCGPNQPAEFLPAETASVGDSFGVPLAGRGSAFGDLDGDGDLDVVITAVGGPPRVLRNDQKLGNHWLRLRLVGKHANRDAIGAWVHLKAGKDQLSRQVMPTRSYLSQSELPVTFGLGKHTAIDSIEIDWPDGSHQKLDPATLKIDAMQTIEQPADLLPPPEPKKADVPTAQLSPSSFGRGPG